MVFVACGLNHQTAPIHIREKLALSNNGSDVLQRITYELDINEALILFTCNRTEIYCEANNYTDIIPWLSTEQKLSTQEVSPYFYSHTEENGIKHLLRVGSGLDSMMLGEPQILGQIKTAYNTASRAG